MVPTKQEDHACHEEKAWDRDRWEAYTPCHVRAQTAVDEPLIQANHHGNSDTTTKIYIMSQSLLYSPRETKQLTAPAASEGIGCSDNGLVEECCGPGLSGHERATKDGDEEA